MQATRLSFELCWAALPGKQAGQRGKHNKTGHGQLWLNNACLPLIIAGGTVAPGHIA